MIQLGLFLVLFGVVGRYLLKSDRIKPVYGRENTLEEQKFTDDKMRKLCREYDFPNWKGMDVYEEVECEKRYLKKKTELTHKLEAGKITHEQYSQEIEPYIMALTPDSMRYLFKIPIS